MSAVEMRVLIAVGWGSGWDPEIWNGAPEGFLAHGYREGKRWPSAEILPRANTGPSSEEGHTMYSWNQHVEREREGRGESERHRDPVRTDSSPVT